MNECDSVKENIGDIQYGLWTKMLEDKHRKNYIDETDLTEEEKILDKMLKNQYEQLKKLNTYIFIKEDGHFPFLNEFYEEEQQFRKRIATICKDVQHNITTISNQCRKEFIEIKQIEQQFSRKNAKTDPNQKTMEIENKIEILTETITNLQTNLSDLESKNGRNKEIEGYELVSWLRKLQIMQLEIQQSCFVAKDLERLLEQEDKDVQETQTNNKLQEIVKTLKKQIDDQLEIQQQYILKAEGLETSIKEEIKGGKVELDLDNRILEIDQDEDNSEVGDSFELGEVLANNEPNKKKKNIKKSNVIELNLEDSDLSEESFEIETHKKVQLINHKTQVSSIESPANIPQIQKNGNQQQKGYEKSSNIILKSNFKRVDQLQYQIESSIQKVTQKPSLKLRQSKFQQLKNCQQSCSIKYLLNDLKLNPTSQKVNPATQVPQQQSKNVQADSLPETKKAPKAVSQKEEQKTNQKIEVTQTAPTSFASSTLFPSSSQKINQPQSIIKDAKTQKEDNNNNKISSEPLNNTNNAPKSQNNSFNLSNITQQQENSQTSSFSSALFSGTNESSIKSPSLPNKNKNSTSNLFSDENDTVIEQFTSFKETSKKSINLDKQQNLKHFTNMDPIKEDPSENLLNTLTTPLLPALKNDSNLPKVTDKDSLWILDSLNKQSTPFTNEKKQQSVLPVQQVQDSNNTKSKQGLFNTSQNAKTNEGLNILTSNSLDFTQKKDDKLSLTKDLSFGPINTQNQQNNTTSPQFPKNDKKEQQSTLPAKVQEDITKQGLFNMSSNQQNNTTQSLFPKNDKKEQQATSKVQDNIPKQGLFNLSINNKVGEDSKVPLQNISDALKKNDGKLFGEKDNSSLWLMDDQNIQNFTLAPPADTPPPLENNKKQQAQPLQDKDNKPKQGLFGISNNIVSQGSSMLFQNNSKGKDLNIAPLNPFTQTSAVSQQQEPSQPMNDSKENQLNFFPKNNNNNATTTTNAKGNDQNISVNPFISNQNISQQQFPSSTPIDAKSFSLNSLIPNSNNNNNNNMVTFNFPKSSSIATPAVNQSSQLFNQAPLQEQPSFSGVFTSDNPQSSGLENDQRKKKKKNENSFMDESGNQQKQTASMFPSQTNQQQNPFLAANNQQGGFFNQQPQDQKSLFGIGFTSNMPQLGGNGLFGNQNINNKGDMTSLFQQPPANQSANIFGFSQNVPANASGQQANGFLSGAPFGNSFAPPAPFAGQNFKFDPSSSQKPNLNSNGLMD